MINETSCNAPSFLRIQSTSLWERRKHRPVIERLVLLPCVQAGAECWEYLLDPNGNCFDESASPPPNPPMSEAL